jgi:Adenylate and Guanylate cyclase catalytic domain
MMLHRPHSSPSTLAAFEQLGFTKADTAKSWRTTRPRRSRPLKSCLSEIVEPCVSQHDGFLAEFPSVVQAVACAGDIQRTMAARYLRTGTLPLLFRIGVHLGDVMAEGDEVFGDGVNVAARLQPLAGAGGVRISRQAYDQVEGKLGVTYRSLGDQRLKNIHRPIGVYPAEFGGDGTGVAAPALKQEIKYCRATDGTRLAHATVGQGPVLVKAANWLNHLELDRDSPAWRPLMIGLAQNHTLIRYDDRGAGMSDWDVDNIHSMLG